MEKIHVLSIDYDGCIAPGTVDKLKEIFEIMYRILKNDPNAKIILMVGSARQYITRDHYCQDINCNNGSCILLMNNFNELFTEFLGTKDANDIDLANRVSIDKLLLEDIHHNKPDGTFFNIRANIKESFLSKENYSLFEKQTPIIPWQDEMKLTQLFIQLNHIATKHPDSDIDFHFFDDRSDILDTVKKITCENIPLKTKLFTHQLVDGKFTNYPKEILIGSAGVKKNYREHTRYYLLDNIYSAYEKDKNLRAFQWINREKGLEKFIFELLIEILKSSIEKNLNNQIKTTISILTEQFSNSLPTVFRNFFLISLLEDGSMRSANKKDLSEFTKQLFTDSPLIFNILQTFFYTTCSLEGDNFTDEQLRFLYTVALRFPNQINALMLALYLRKTLPQISPLNQAEMQAMSDRFLSGIYQPENIDAKKAIIIEKISSCLLPISKISHNYLVTSLRIVITETTFTDKNSAVAAIGHWKKASVLGDLTKNHEQLIDMLNKTLCKQVVENSTALHGAFSKKCVNFKKFIDDLPELISSTLGLQQHTSLTTT